ncbi:MAG TPA: hypothetical protein VHN11_21135 [Xanthobacteraceae bacterium]|jgi:hypothetical protein|nr:hypothetical protein [Xanthobacteraceae bacterium]
MSVPYLVSPNYGYGSVIITPTTGNANGVSFIAEESTPTATLAKTTRETELGAPNGWIGFQERRTWRGTLQIATNVTAHPDVGDEFILPRITASPNSTPTVVNVTFAFDDMGEPKRQRDFWKLEAAATEKA